MITTKIDCLYPNVKVGLEWLVQAHIGRGYTAIQGRKKVGWGFINSAPAVYSLIYWQVYLPPPEVLAPATVVWFPEKRLRNMLNIMLFVKL